ncbi:MAG: ribonuclease III [Pseudomonadota bacterium]
MARRASSASYGALYEALGYTFQDETLLQTALTHASARLSAAKARRGRGEARTPDNERLEFLGDRVLGLAIATKVTDADPGAREGELARRFNALVRGESCADVARRIGLGAFVRMSAAEAESGGRDKDTILADACEALLGAVYLEAGFERARAVIDRLWAPLLSAPPARVIDAKTALQEWAQGRALPLPIYRLVGQEGPDHAPSFDAQVDVEGFEPARGHGPSKRHAEQRAAELLLRREGVWDPGASDEVGSGPSGQHGEVTAVDMAGTADTETS